tara:strand:+ start:2830 stop:3138 length:309 start_codon:yes stop_codon:yes gene_type:complete
VKKDASDGVVLCFEGHDALRFWWWDGETGYSKTGKKEDARGGKVQVCAESGKGGSRIWQAAESNLLRKIHHYNSKKRGRYLARVAFAPGDAERVMRRENGDF